MSGVWSRARSGSRNLTLSKGSVTRVTGKHRVCRFFLETDEARRPLPSPLLPVSNHSLPFFSSTFFRDSDRKQLSLCTRTRFNLSYLAETRSSRVPQGSTFSALPSTAILFSIVERSCAYVLQIAMKETLTKQEIKREWEENSVDEGSPRMAMVATNPDEQSVESPRTVITARRHVRTITTAGHITEMVVDPEPDSPDNLQSQRQQQHHRSMDEQGQQTRSRTFQEEQQQDQACKQNSQTYVQISHTEAEIQQQDRSREQRIVYLTSNGQEVRVVAEAVDPSTLTVKETVR